MFLIVPINRKKIFWHKDKEIKSKKVERKKGKLTSRRGQSPSALHEKILRPRVQIAWMHLNPLHHLSFVFCDSLEKQQEKWNLCRRSQRCVLTPISCQMNALFSGSAGSLSRTEVLGRVIVDDLSLRYFPTLGSRRKGGNNLMILHNQNAS
jgi:hypothetical protein